jgi:6-phosphofructokinase
MSGSLEAVWDMIVWSENKTESLKERLKKMGEKQRRMGKRYILVWVAHEIG